MAGLQNVNGGIKPLKEKVHAITEKLPPKNLKDRRSFMGAINQMNTFIPNLANLCASLRPLLKRDQEWNWKDEHELAFENIKEAIKKMTKQNDFERNLELRKICDASQDGLGAVQQRKSEEGWETTHFASRFLKEFEKKYSINELELFAVVWSEENFRNYVYGTEFEVVSDHKALMIILKDDRANKSFSSRLTRLKIEVLQTLGIYTSAAQYETDEFIQKIAGVLMKPDTTKISRLPTPWKKKFKCLSFGANEFIYMDKRLVIPRALRLVIIRSLHYGHPWRGYNASNKQQSLMTGGQDCLEKRCQ